VNRDDRVLAVVFAAEHLLDLASLDLFQELVETAIEIVEHRLPCLRPLGKDGQVVDPPAQ
jgi:hypothetical protein